MSKDLRSGIHIFSNDPISFFEFLANDCSRKLFGAITVSCCIEIPSSVSSAFGKSYRKSEKFLKLFVFIFKDVGLDFDLEIEKKLVNDF